MGWFFGQLDRDRVAVLYDGGVELPSDLRRPTYIPDDAGGAWKHRLGKQLKLRDSMLTTRACPKRQTPTLSEAVSPRWSVTRRRS